ncbi:MAG: SH3 domain-containing protein [Desulfobacterales bacterium]
MKTTCCLQTAGNVARKASKRFPSAMHAGLILLVLSAAFPCGLPAAPLDQNFSEATVMVPVGNMHIRPAESASVVDTLKKGDRIVLIGREGEWFIAKLPDQRLGWVHESLFHELPAKEAQDEEAETGAVPREAAEEVAESPSGQVPAEKDLLFQALVRIPSARVREKPSLSSDIRFGLRKGEKVDVITQEKNWYQIRSQDGRTGWAFHSLFRLLPSETASQPREAKEAEGIQPFQAVTKIELARIRELPSFESDVLFRVKKGETVSVTEIKEDWFRIENKEGKSGWAHHLHFSRLPSATGISPPVISAIRFETDSDEAEKVIIALNGFHPPDETFPLDEEVPPVVCDFYEVSLAEGIDKIIPVNGKLIRTIRLGIHKGSRPKVRVVVDLDPRKKYGVEQVFFKKDNLYTLIFKPLAE